MVQVLNPSSIWGQLASLCFLCSALFGDLLLIRISLFLAYSWMLVLALVGYPSWPSVSNPGFIGIDGIVWASLNLFFHGLAMLQLIYDERPIKFANEEQEQLWRYMNRRCGMGRLEMQQSLKRAQRAEFRAGDVILDSPACHTTLVLLVEGLATFTFRDAQGKTLKEATLTSGGTFDIGMLNIFGVYLAFEKGPEEQVTLTACTDCLVYQFGIDDLDYLATRCAPAMPAFWRSFALCQVGLEWHASVNQYKPPVNGRGQPEVAGVRDGTARSSDFTDPLEPWEEPRRSLRSVLTWLPSQLAPFLPPGMRHAARPHAGAMARNRLMALGAAHRSAGSVLRRAPLRARPTARALISAIHEQDGLFSAEGEQMGCDSAASESKEAAGAANGTGAAEAQPSSPASLPTDQLTLVAAELAELTYPDTVGGNCSGDCGTQREAWQANVTAVTSSMGATATRFLYGNATSSQAILLIASNKAIVAFRGTEDSRDVQINLAANLTQLPLGPRFNGSGSAPPMVHEGFLAAANEIYQQVGAALRELDPSGGLPVFTIGHSLGGALATLNAALLQSADSPANRVAGVFTFGSPRVGDESWAAAYERLGLAPTTLRVVNGRDIVPLVPPPAASGSGFQHVGQPVFISEGDRTFLGPGSQLGSCANDTCGAWDGCLANQTSVEATCADLNTQVQNICTSQGWLGNLVDVFSNFDEDALGRLVCPLFNNGLQYQPLCCALSTLWSMAKREAADLLPSLLGGVQGEAESPLAFVLRFHSSSNYVRRVAEDVVFANDSSFKFDRALPVPTTSGSMQAGLSLHVMAAVAVAVWVLLA